MLYIEFMPLVNEDLVADVEKIHSHRHILSEEDQKAERQAYSNVSLLARASARSLSDKNPFKRMFISRSYNRALRRYVSAFRRQFEKNIMFIV